MKPGGISIVGGWLVMQLTPSCSMYSEWSFYTHDCTDLQATRVYHGVPTSDDEDAGEIIAFDTCSTVVSESRITSHVIYTCENNEVVVTEYANDTCTTAIATPSPHSSCRDQKVASCSTTPMDPEWTVLEADKWSSVTSFYSDEECTTLRGDELIMDQAMAMEIYGYDGWCSSDPANNRNVALVCVNGEVQVASYAPTDSNCDGGWMFLDLAPSSCHERPSGSGTSSVQTRGNYVQMICGQTYLGGSINDNSSPAPEKAVSADCARKSNVAGSDVVLLLGQSNMSGWGSGYNESIDGPLNPRIEQWSRANEAVTASEHLEHADFGPSTLTRVGSGTAFGRAYVETVPEQRNVLLVPAAQAATALVNDVWSPGGILFEDAVVRMNAALASHEGNCVAAVLWHQGENDDVGEETYRLAWIDMMATLRTRIPAIAEAPVVLGEFTPAWIANSPGRTAPVRAAIRSIPDHVAFTAVAPSAGLLSNPGDVVHFSAEAQRLYGRRYFEKLGDALSNTDPGLVTAEDASPPANLGLTTTAPTTEGGSSSANAGLPTIAPTTEGEPAAAPNGTRSALNGLSVDAILFAAAAVTSLAAVFGGWA